jgi:hypothetical protein
MIEDGRPTQPEWFPFDIFHLDVEASVDVVGSMNLRHRYRRVLRDELLAIEFYYKDSTIKFRSEEYTRWEHAVSHSLAGFPSASNVALLLTCRPRQPTQNHASSSCEPASHDRPVNQDSAPSQQG